MTPLIPWLIFGGWVVDRVSPRPPAVVYVRARPPPTPSYWIQRAAWVASPRPFPRRVPYSAHDTDSFGLKRP